MSYNTSLFFFFVKLSSLPHPCHVPAGSVPYLGITGYKFQTALIFACGHIYERPHLLTSLNHIEASILVTSVLLIFGIYLLLVHKVLVA